MAKGWESKSVEDQIQASSATDEKNNQNKRHMPEELEARRRREVLLLSRVRVERTLQMSQNPRYREQLMKALADLDAQLSAL